MKYAENADQMGIDANRLRYPRYATAKEGKT
jgi:hypothetical protein